MQRNYAMVILAAMLVGTNSGCGTLVNLAGKDDSLINYSQAVEEVRKPERPPYPFGGVANDLAWLNGAVQPIGVIGCVVDVPLSLAGDFITLPLTICRYLSIDRTRTNDEDGTLPYDRLGQPVDRPAAK